MLGPFTTASRHIAIHQVSLLSHAATVAHRLRIDVHNDDNAWQRGPLWPHRMGPIMSIAVEVALIIPSIQDLKWRCPQTPATTHIIRTACLKFSGHIAHADPSMFPSHHSHSPGKLPEILQPGKVLENYWNFMLDVKLLGYVDLRSFWHCNGSIAYKSWQLCFNEWWTSLMNVSYFIFFACELWPKRQENSKVGLENS